MSTIGSPSTKTRVQRSVSDLAAFQRSAARAHLDKAAEAAAPPNVEPVSRFSPVALWGWVRSYLAYVLRQKHLFPPVTASPTRALYGLVDEVGGEQEVRVSIAGDWGTGTAEAEAVAGRMQQFLPHFTIHLGDIYYVGDPQAVNENCRGIPNPNNNYTAVVWPIGSKGSFALNGNHEMYANGGGYFDVFLPVLGIRDATGATKGQQTSFFCLQNQYWRIIAIDTGYHSMGVPVLSGIPGISRIPGIGGDCRLDDKLVQWIRNIVQPEKDSRGLIILSHHQNYSAFEGEDQFEKPAQQLWDAGVQRPVLWFWGHEHRLAGYDLYGTCGLKSHGRCIGHGGMPVDRATPCREPAPIFYDNRCAANGYGVNGYADLTFNGDQLRVSYNDLDGAACAREAFAVSAEGGVKLVSREVLVKDPDFYPPG